tara:strand:- start:271 stop:627 length:357 start_codon:yes stop_codon:yes gene_type:complete
MNKLITLFGMILLIGGCAANEPREPTKPSPSVDEIMQSWINSSEAQLIQTWGIPDSTYTTGGVKFITYKSNSQRDIYKYAGVGEERRFTGTLYLNCEQTFQIVNEIITNYNWKGNNCD